MTAAQKTAKAKFKQAIAYRQKTGVSLKEAFAHIYGKKVGAVKKKVAPKKKAAKKVVKKVIRKIVKKAAPKKVAKKKLTKQDYDKRYQAKKPGKRTSASGNTYYENRANRSDRGKLLGIGNIALERYQKILKEIDNREFILEKNKQYKNSLVNTYGLKSYASNLNKSKAYIKELKTHAKELKKSI
jgi:hypothetical protein